jgi:hypothetical protein
MAADWHPDHGFDFLVLRLFAGTAFVGFTGSAMNVRDTVDIGLRVIKC